MRRWVALFALLLMSGCGGPRLSQYGTPTHLSCVPYARAVSGIELSGNAYQWWNEAAGVYPRARTPAVGAVLVLKPHGSMTVGHLAVVTGLSGPRQILVTQSNWLPGRIEHDQPMIDVSNANDWTLVRVWYEPAGAMGVTAYPAYGFILPR